MISVLPGEALRILQTSIDENVIQMHKFIVDNRRLNTVPVMKETARALL